MINTVNSPIWPGKTPESALWPRSRTLRLRSEDISGEKAPCRLLEERSRTRRDLREKSEAESGPTSCLSERKRKVTRCESEQCTPDQLQCGVDGCHDARDDGDEDEFCREFLKDRSSSASVSVSVSVSVDWGFTSKQMWSRRRRIMQETCLKDSIFVVLRLYIKNVVVVVSGCAAAFEDGHFVVAVLCV